MVGLWYNTTTYIAYRFQYYHNGLTKQMIFSLKLQVQKTKQTTEKLSKK